MESTHSRIKSEALRNLVNLTPQTPSDSPRYKLAEFIPELLDFVKQASSQENACVYNRALRHFIGVTGDMPLEAVYPKHVDQVNQGCHGFVKRSSKQTILDDLYRSTPDDVGPVGGQDQSMRVLNEMNDLGEQQERIIRKSFPKVMVH